eukprot:scaffold45305_cov63-Phaeocystis_antarctica.AAC.1
MFSTCCASTARAGRSYSTVAADRLAWQTMLRDGAPPPTFRKPPPPAVPMPIFITLYVVTRVL